MEQQGEKKKWIAPELVVLVRSHPQEAVLAGCKFFPGAGGGGVNVAAIGCIETGCTTACNNLADLS